MHSRVYFVFQLSVNLYLLGVYVWYLMYMTGKSKYGKSLAVESLT